MKVPFHAPGRQYASLRDEIDAAIARVLASGWYLRGPATEAFEAAFAAHCGVSHCVGLANGTDALEIALRVLSCGPGTEVVTVANAGGYTTIACGLTGATPVYVDVDPGTLLMDLAQATAAVTARTGCVVATHLFGRVVNIPQLRQLLDAQGHSRVPIVEDCAQAHGARWGEHPVGSMGAVAAFSFYPTKNLAALGDGGALVTGHKTYADAARQLAQYGWGDKYHRVRAGGRNSRLDEIQAAVLTVKLPHLDDYNRRRRQIIATYRAAAPALFGGGEDTADMAGMANMERDGVGHLCVVRAPERDRMRVQLAASGVATDIHYPVLDPDAPAVAASPQVVHDLSHSQRAASEIFSLPCFPELSADEQGAVCDALRDLP